MTENTIFGGLFVILGLLNIFLPGDMLRLRTIISKKVYGAEFKPSKKTVKIQMFLGVFVLLIGIGLLTIQ